MKEPVVSVVIPTFARPDQLRECLTAVSRLDAGVPFEVVVVDDGSPLPLDRLVLEFRNAMPLRLLTQSRRGPGAARNAGAAAARGQYLAFTDDDCRPAPGWLSALTAEFKRNPRQLLGGRVENALGHNLFSEASERIGRFVYEYGESGQAREPFFTTNNFALPADLFRAALGFTSLIPSATAEDKEFCARWRGLGLPLAHVPGAVVYHAHPLNLRAFMQQHYNYGRGILAFRLLRRGKVAPSVVPEPLAFYLRLIRSPLRSGTTVRHWILTGLILLSQLATAIGAGAQLVRWRELRQKRLASSAEV